MRINKNTIAFSGIVAIFLLLMPSCVETNKTQEGDDISEMDELTENLDVIDSKNRSS